MKDKSCTCGPGDGSFAAWTHAARGLPTQYPARDPVTLGLLSPAAITIGYTSHEK
jgi:hypothetical protein